jgi:hypothetical protein
MNSKIILLLSLIFLGLVGCNSLGTKEELVARIGSEKIYLSDVELPQKFAQVDKKSARFAEIFNEVVFNEGMAAFARTSYPGISAIADADVKRMNDRYLTMIYQQFHVMEMLGFKESDVKKFYEANRDSFPLDSFETFNDIRGKVAQKLYLKTNADSLKRFIEMKLPEFTQPAQAELYFYRSRARKDFAKIESAILAKTPLDSINGANRVTLYEKTEHELLDRMEIKPFIFGDSAIPVNVPPKTLVVPLSLGDTVFYTIQIISRKEAVEPVLEDHLEEIHRQFVELYKQDMIRESYNRLKEKYAIVEPPIDDSHLKEYYNSHIDLYKTLPGYSVYHIEHTDSTLLNKEVLSQVFSLADFKKKAIEFNQNPFTKEKEGLVGHIKESHTLPYGIGLIPQLFNEFKDKPAGTISSVIKAPNTGKYHVFYLDKIVASEQKSFERVRSHILNVFASDISLELDSSTVLLTSNGKPVVTEKDLRILHNEIPVNQRSAFTRSKLMNFLSQWAVYALEAKSLDLDKSWEYKAFVRQTRRDIVNQLFRDSLKVKEEFTEEKLKAAYQEVGQIIFPNAPFEEMRPLLKTYLKTPENILKREYYFNEEAYQSFANFDAARGMIFRNISSIEEKNQWKRLEKEMWSKYKVTVFNPTMPPLKTILSSDSLILQAENDYNRRKLNEARANYDLVRSIYPDNEVVFKKATFEIATIDNELENYTDAESEYRVFYKLWPNDPDAEKALFSRAFVLSENLKRDSLALPLFKEFISKYPKSELKESVDWLIKNIESNGKLAQELVEKISQSETTDSIGSVSNQKEEKKAE